MERCIVVERRYVCRDTQASEEGRGALEMWIWMKMLMISWTHNVTIQQALDTIHDQQIFTISSDWRKHSGLGMCYTIRRLNYIGLLHTIIEGRIEGKRGRE